MPKFVTCKGCHAARPELHRWHGMTCPSCKATYQRERNARNKVERVPTPKITFQQWHDRALARHNKKGYLTGWGAKPKLEWFTDREEWARTADFWQKNYQDGAAFVNSKKNAADKWASGKIKERLIQNGTHKDSRVCEKCPTIAAFGGQDGKRRFCQKHKEDGMKHVIHIPCEVDGCEKQRTFGPTGQHARSCAEHARGGVYVERNKVTCEVDGCSTSPSYGETNSTHCALHGKAAGLRDVKTKMCEHEGCVLGATFSHGDSPRKFCQEHAQAGMINVKVARCVACELPAMYGLPGEYAQWCSRHKIRQPGVLYRPRKVCTHDECRSFATHGKYRQNIFCESHAPPRVRTTVEQVCTGCHLVDLLSGYQLCEHCDDDAYSLCRRGCEQRSIKHLFDVNGVDYIPEQTIGNTKLMPDFLIRVGDHLIAFEVDEHQHSNSRYKDEVGRMTRMRDADARVAMFIRYNPDEYEGGQASTQERHGAALRVVKEFKKEEHAGKVPVVYMYYNGFTEPKYQYLV